jgi:hypothetical protein
VGAGDTKGKIQHRLFALLIVVVYDTGTSYIFPNDSCPEANNSE